MDNGVISGEFLVKQSKNMLPVDHFTGMLYQLFRWAYSCRVEFLNYLAASSSGQSRRQEFPQANCVLLAEGRTFRSAIVRTWIKEPVIWDFPRIVVAIGTRG